MSPEESVEIRCVTLDDVFQQNGIEECDLLKMDIEGGEFECLYSASAETLGRIRMLRMEYHNLPDLERYNDRVLVTFLQKAGLEITRMHPYRSGNSGILWAKRKALPA